MKSLKAVLLAFWLGSVAFAQLPPTQHEVTVEKDQTITGKKTFSPGVTLGPILFSALNTTPPQTNGTIVAVSDASATSPCTGGGAGAFAKRINGDWDCSGGGGSAADFASPPPLGNVAPNTVGATTVTVNGSGLFFQPQSNCIFEGSDPTLHELEDVSGSLMWLYQGLGGPCTKILTYTPLPDGVNPTDKQVPAWNAATGSWTIQTQTTSSAIDVRDVGVDCSGALDSGAALNTLFANISGRQVTFPDVCSIKTTVQLVIQSQSQFVLHGNGHKVGTGGFAGPIIYGCNAAASGPVLYINRSGYGRIEGIGITARGPSGCSTSTFTGSVQVDSTGNPGVTTHDLIFENDGFTTSAQGTATANYIGLSITDGGKQNGEMIRVKNSWIHCQNSTGSIGIDLENPTSDKDVFESNNIENCYIGVKHNNGNATIKDNLLSSLGDFSVFGSNGAAIYVGSCSAGPINILNNEVDSGGDFINSANDGVGLGCNAGLNIEGNMLGISDPTPNNYVINIGNCCVQGYNLIGNQFLVTSNTSQYLVGSASQGLSGPLGYLYDLNNSLRTPTSSNSLGFTNLNYPFQQGEYHTPLSNTGGTLNATFGPNGVIPEFSSYSKVLFANPPKNSGAQQSPFLAFRSYTGSAYDDWAFEGFVNGSGSQLALVHSKGTSTNNWFVAEGKTSGITLGTITTPVAPSGVNVIGTGGATTYTYSVVDFGPNGNTLASPTTSTAVGNATLSSSNYNQILFGFKFGTTRVCIRREAGGATQGIIGCVPVAAGNQTYSTQDDINTYEFRDTGLTGDSSAAPALNTTGVLDASLSPYIFLPISAGYVATAQGNIGYDTTAKNWHVWQNAADRLMAVINGAVTNNDCAKFVVSGSTVSLQDAGACAGGTTTNPLTVNNSNSGAASGTTFDGSVARTISTNTIGAPNLATANTFSTGLQDMSAADYLQPKHASDPGTCTEGQIEENTTSHVMKFCSATNTWTSLSTGSTTNALTVNNGNSGAASGSTFNGSSAVTISTNTIGAPNLGTANTFGAFLQDLSASTIKLPFGAGFTTTANGNMGYDTTNLNWHIWQNGADRINAVINGATTNGDCSKFVVSGSTVSLQDAGVGCGPATVPQMWLPWATANELLTVPTAQTGSGANSVSCTQFVPANGITATKMSVAINTASAAQTVNVGIYDNSLNLVRDSGTFSCTTAGGLALSNTVSSFTLTAGSTYYVCAAFTDTTCAIQGSAGATGYANMANKNASRELTCGNGLSAGALPSACGTVNPTNNTKKYLVLLEQ